jgi:hypothetical protein
MIQTQDAICERQFKYLKKYTCGSWLELRRHGFIMRCPPTSSPHLVTSSLKTNPATQNPIFLSSNCNHKNMQSFRLYLCVCGLEGVEFDSSLFRVALNVENNNKQYYYAIIELSVCTTIHMCLYYINTIKNSYIIITHYILYHIKPYTYYTPLYA